MTLVTEKYPKDLSVYVIPPGGAGEEELFRDNGFRISKEPKFADILVFTGGSDVTPSMYGEKPLACTSFQISRDIRELRDWRNYGPGKFKIGICRGAQFLNVLNGGRLWQDVDNHALHGGHEVTDILTQKKHVVSSTHHQQMRPAGGSVIVATTQLSTQKHSDLVHWKKGEQAPFASMAIDYEVVWYPKTKSLCFQGHPEYHDKAYQPSCRNYFFEVLRRFI